MLMGHDTPDPTPAMLMEDSPQEEGLELEHEKAIVSMHATSHNPVHSTIRFKGQIRTVPVFALIDSGSTHIFVNPSVLHTNLH
jgi:hypothetical protein